MAFPTVYKYISETGNTAFLDEVIPFANKDEATVYEHLKRAVAFSLDHLGPHGMPAGLYADWNDCLRLGANGESSFVALQFYYAMTILKIFAEYKKDTEYVQYLEETQKAFGEKFRNCAGITTASYVVIQNQEKESVKLLLLKQICG